MNSVRRCLVLSPHYDDAELGCGGTIAKMIRSGTDVHVVAFALQRTLNKAKLGTLQKEMASSASILGFSGEMLDMESRRLNESRQEILDLLMQAGKDFKPNLVIAPSLVQTHQDHCVMAQEAFRAFKYTSLLGYDMPWNNLDSGKLTTFVELEKEDLEHKILASQQYTSQMPRPYFEKDVIISLARTRGLQCGRELAEAFETYRWFL